MMSCVEMKAKACLQHVTITCTRFSCFLCRGSSVRRRFGNRLCVIKLHNGALRNAPHSSHLVVEADVGCLQSTVAHVAIPGVVLPTARAEEANPAPRARVYCRVIVGVLPFFGAPCVQSKVIMIFVLWVPMVDHHVLRQVRCVGRTE